MDEMTLKLFNANKETMKKAFNSMNLTNLKFKSPNLKYFLNVAKEYLTFESNGDHSHSKLKKIGMMGFNIPEELVIACGGKPVWILGGSSDCSIYADTITARDTEPSVKAALGMLQSKAFPMFADIDLVIAPIYSDSMRKATYILSKEFNTLIVEIPPIKERSNSLKRWASQMEEMMNRITSVTGKKAQKKDIVKACKIVSEAKKQAQIFINNYEKVANLLPSSVFTLIVNSYYMSNSLEEWAERMKALNYDIEGLSHYTIHDLEECATCPKILLTGSSIFFPNMKIPVLFDETGLKIFSMETELVKHLWINVDIKYGFFKKNMITKIATSYYEKDSSQAFVNNNTRLNSIFQALENTKVDGVVYHVIRGQVSCDFEFESIENMLIKKNISVLRIETDYNFQDVEQLRIRLEAFAEMIKAKVQKSAVNRKVG